MNRIIAIVLIVIFWSMSVSACGSMSAMMDWCMGGMDHQSHQQNQAASPPSALQAPFAPDKTTNETSKIPDASVQSNAPEETHQH